MEDPGAALKTDVQGLFAPSEMEHPGNLFALGHQHQIVFCNRAEGDHQNAVDDHRHQDGQEGGRGVAGAAQPQHLMGHGVRGHENPGGLKQLGHQAVHRPGPQAHEGGGGQRLGKDLDILGPAGNHPGHHH